jgi:hypothetical protein
VVTLVVVVTLVAMATFDDDDVIGMTSLELSVNEDFTTLEVKRESGGCVVFIAVIEDHHQVNISITHNMKK